MRPSGMVTGGGKHVHSSLFLVQRPWPERFPRGHAELNSGLALLSNPGSIDGPLQVLNVLLQPLPDTRFGLADQVVLKSLLLGLMVVALGSHPAPGREINSKVTLYVFAVAVSD